MKDHEFNAALVARITELTKVIAEQQTLVLALVFYLREQPSYDAIRFGTILREQREHVGLPKLQVEDPSDILQAFLRDFEPPDKSRH